MVFDKLKAWLWGEAPAAREPEPASAPVERRQPDPPASLAAPGRRGETARTAASRARRTEDLRLESEARGLFDGGDTVGALRVLGVCPAFARHTQELLPCLCRRCLRPDVVEAEALGVRYVRDFVVAQQRVLFYWMPAELVSDAPQVRASMRSELRSRLRIRAVRGDEWRTTKNPFTGEPMAVSPRWRRRIVNPFTGKALP